MADHGTTHSLLLALPAEVRIKIWAEVSPPFKEHLIVWRGLLASSTQIRAEVTAEATKNMAKYLEKVEKEWDEHYPASPLRITRPSTANDLKTMTVLTPKSFFRRTMALELPPPIAQLLSLHLSHLVFEVYEDGSRKYERFWGSTFARNFQVLLSANANAHEAVNGEMVTPESLEFDQLTFKWDQSSKRENEYISTLLEKEFCRHDVHMTSSEPGGANAAVHWNRSAPRGYDGN